MKQCWARWKLLLDWCIVSFSLFGIRISCWKPNPSVLCVILHFWRMKLDWLQQSSPILCIFTLLLNCVSISCDSLHLSNLIHWLKPSSDLSLCNFTIFFKVNEQQWSHNVALPCYNKWLYHDTGVSDVVTLWEHGGLEARRYHQLFSAAAPDLSNRDFSRRPSALTITVQQSF